MGTYEEYIQKSNELFAYINGRYSIPQDMVLAFKDEYESLLNEVAFNGGYPIGTASTKCDDPISNGYAFVMEQASFKKEEVNCAYQFFNGRNIPLKDTGDSYIGNLVATKSKRHYVIITNNSKSVKAIELINELFYKTPPILIMTIGVNGEPVFVKDNSSLKYVPSKTENKSTSSKSNDVYDLPTTGWDTLD
ncbi:MAG: hypothetical protein ACI4MZ_04520 [Christensenellales bacterium]